MSEIDVAEQYRRDLAVVAAATQTLAAIVNGSSRVMNYFPNTPDGHVALETAMQIQGMDGEIVGAAIPTDVMGMISFSALIESLCVTHLNAAVDRLIAFLTSEDVLRSLAAVREECRNGRALREED